MSAENLSQPDERMRAESLATKLMKKPELGAIGGVVLVTLFFLFTADSTMFTLSGIMNFMTPAAQLGILGIAAAMLMIGGEFDLSIGSMVAFAGMVFGVLTVNMGLPLIFAIPLTMAFAAGIGAVNGTIVLRTGLPSFIVTLAGLFILRGAALVGLKLFTGGSTQLRGVRDAVEGDWLAPLFSGDAFPGLFAWLSGLGLIDSFKSGMPKVPGIPVEIIWCLLIALVATYVLVRTPVGNWIFATGGDSNAAKNSGVPVRGVKISLFMLTACAASLVAIITVMDAGSTDARRGFMKEFEAIITAVIGGCLLTGGYGSAIGAFFGAIIFGMVTIGLTYTSFDQDWFQIFLGGMLLLAVVFNNVIRKRVTGER
ncbi:ABC transporter permease [Paracoccus seriniphilus]|uniref:Xylose transport system permease protein XylH n=1 Tax=Paracoccus seriniphilus TaxID=184748 RepID=A0A239Q2W1_9RHOB|nr:ABC transporter permease [Paracoccus seriniphilus]WCR15337.1 ABC transporter permease [Paracoccus seriniphilus]WCR15641.1 ABC transporter permease [Paracoccus seriniphilus]SNT76939.1 monosaccharide ABC transporter membrane protein, CUT2 family [Paracoccus seriniphilus]